MNDNPPEHNKRVCSEALAYVEKNWGLKKEKFIARGGFGEVYLATDDQHRKHAVKVSVLPVDGTKQRTLQYLNRELEITLKMRHVNVVRLYHGVSLAECSIMDREFCDTSLQDYIVVKVDGKKALRALSESEFRVIVKQLTSGILAIHGLGIVHRDIKPDNVLMVMKADGSYIAKFADLGLAKSELEARTCLGTPVYLAPEVLDSKGIKMYGNRCDYWSLGVMYYLLLAGRFPFRPGNMDTMCNTLCDVDFVAISLPSKLNVSECCRHFVRHHLFKDPDSRMCDEEVMKHPFVMPRARMMCMTQPLNGDSFLKPMVVDVELGDICFRKAEERLGDKLNEPHPFSNYESEPILWGDVARAIGISDSDLDDMLVFINGGVCCKKDTPVEMKGIEDICALVVSSKNGIMLGEMNVVDGVSLSDSDVEAFNSEDIQCTTEYLNSLLISFLKFRKCCLRNCSISEMIMTNCDAIAEFQSVVLKPERMAKELRDLQEEVCKKFDTFPKVGLCLPVSDSRGDVFDGDSGREMVNALIADVASIRDLVQNKISSHVQDINDELMQLLQLWEKNKGLIEEVKKKLVEAC